MKGRLFFVFLLLICVPHSVNSTDNKPSIFVEFSEMYDVNLSGEMDKRIGVVGVGYGGKIIIQNLDEKEISEDMLVELTFTQLFSEFTADQPIYYYEKLGNKTSINEKQFIDRIPLLDCQKCEFDFSIMFSQTGIYLVSWKLKDVDSNVNPKTRFVSIISPIEFENLNQQKAVAESQNRTAQSTKSLAWVTGFMAVFTLILAWVTWNANRNHSKQIEGLHLPNLNLDVVMPSGIPKLKIANLGHGINHLKLIISVGTEKLIEKERDVLDKTFGSDWNIELIKERFVKDADNLLYVELFWTSNVGGNFYRKWKLKIKVFDDYKDFKFLEKIEVDSVNPWEFSIVKKFTAFLKTLK
jgi:hypothetical protein